MNLNNNNKLHYTLYKDSNLHYKLYKFSKKWIVAGVVTAATTFAISAIDAFDQLSVNADVNTLTSNNDNPSNASGISDSSSASTSTLTESSSSSISVTNSSSSVNLNSATSSSLSSSSVVISNENINSIANVQQSGNTSLASNANVSSSSNISINSNMSSSTSGSLVSGNSQSTSHNSASDLNSLASDSSSLNHSNDSSNNISSAFNSLEQKSANDSLASSQNVSVYGSTISLNASIASDASDDLKKHIKEVDGNYYYYSNDNKISGSMLINDGGNFYYFDNNGELSTNNPNFSSSSQGTITTSSNNAIDSQSSNSITNLDGFLTPDTWYRPKEILKDGTNWQPSTENDMRPLLTVWWPSKQVEVNYLNYMGQQGLVDNANFDSNSDQEALNSAASAVQANIESKIASSNGNTDWLKTTISNFTKTQAQWNMNSEDYNSNDGYQGGTLSYQNSDQTPYNNSVYRLLNRNPSQQDGQRNYDVSSYIGYEFLLGNDVDNSNPVVQAENLNWLHYLMNFGSITQNDPNANFDSIRVDAVDNMDADTLNIAAQYLKDAYQLNQSETNANNHISILEDWSKNDPQYVKDNGSNYLTIDSYFLDSVTSNLFAAPGQRGSLTSFINGLVNRSNDDGTNSANPNYSIVRAHDSGIQDIIAQIIKTKIDPNSNGYVLTNDQLEQAFQIYDNDQKQTVKQYTQYNIPSAYALMLTNKDTVPRIYYGDMYTDDGQYMATQTQYFNAIDTLLKARIKYVAGGQSMNVQYVNGASSDDYNSNNSVLTSVRYGLGANDANSIGNVDTRTSGLAVIESNDPNLTLLPTDKIVVNMGAAHKNQSYQALISPTDSGLSTNLNGESSGPIIDTDDNGNLVLDASDIKGYSNPQLSGYLSVWVPTGATQNQDVRTNASDQKTNDGQIFNSNPALDSNVIYEGFSNFQSMPTNNDEYTNVVLAKNAQLFNDWGVTYMELAPQYRSTNDNSFVDSTVQNGYAFNDRYDLGFNTPTKYGTAEQLADAIRSFHKNGIKVIADYVPDQLYSLPNKQVVNVDRTNNMGRPSGDSNMQDTLYVTASKGSGTDYQAKYGGAFLDELQQKYPDLFTTKQVSTGQTIDPSVKIKVWEAKYLNGTNLQGNGAGSVLSNAMNSDYFTVPNANNSAITTTFLPKQLSGENVTYGLTLVDGQQRYISTSGYVAKNAFLQDDNGNWYYVDSDGDFVKKPTVINSNGYYFLSNGMNLRNFVLKSADGKLAYYQNNGSMANVSGYYTDTNGTTRFVTPDGDLATGLFQVDNNVQYYNDEGTQIKGSIVNLNGKNFYFDANSGNLVKNGFFSQGNNWYYSGDDGQVVTGNQTIAGQNLYFDPNGIQAKGRFVNIDGKQVYFDGSQGHEVKNGFFLYNNNWYYADADGNFVTGKQTINGQNLYFDSNGIQTKGNFANIDGKQVYFDGSQGHEVKNGFFLYNNNWYYADADGNFVTGKQMINGQNLYFDSNGIQTKGNFANIDGKQVYFDGSQGHEVKNGFFLYNNNWYYADADGDIVTGKQQIDNQNVYFNKDGSQAKGQFVANSDGTLSYYETNLGNLVTSPFTVNGKTYNLNDKGILSQPNQFVTSPSNNQTYYLNNDSQITKGIVTINNHKYDFDNNGVMIVNDIFRDTDGTVYMAGNNGVLSVLIDRNPNESNSESSSSSAANLPSHSNGSSTVSQSTHSNNASSNSASHSNNSSASSTHNGSSASSNTNHSNGSSITSNSANGSATTQSNHSSNASSSSSSHSNDSSASSSTNNASSSSNYNNQSSNNSTASGVDSSVTTSNSSNGEDDSKAATTNNVDNSSYEDNDFSTSKTNSVSSNTYNGSIFYTSTNSSSSTDSNGTNSSSSSNATSSSSSTHVGKGGSKKTPKHKVIHDKAKKYKIDMKHKQAALLKAKKQLISRRNNKNLYQYHYSLKAYYKSEKKYLIISGKYSSKYYYDFDFSKMNVYISLKRNIYVYNGKQFNISKRLRKLYKNDKIKFTKIVRNGKTTRLVVGHNEYITGLKSIIHKMN